MVKERGRSNIVDHNFSYIDNSYNLNHKFLRCVIHLIIMGALAKSLPIVRSYMMFFFFSLFIPDFLRFNY